jgi:lipopolysaccharide/colanic/teichoic acid biosynthesis glycosyltransferase/RimJ/RimL family protein N-acetyltransferase
MYKNYGKRIVDLLIAIPAILLAIPCMLLIAIGCMISFHGRIFFVQERIGIHEQKFRLYKFISMQPLIGDAELSDTQRLTSWGRFIRNFSLDELPQLLNVIKGDMSIVGPRPLLERYLPFYTETEKLRHSVRPGITGLAQVNGRNTLNWDDRLMLDVQYVYNISFAHDLRILIKTAKVIIRRDALHADPRSVLADLDLERGQHQIYLKDHVILRPLRMSDAEQLLPVKNNTEAAQWLENDPKVFSLEDMKAWITYHQNKESNLILAIEDKSKHCIIGHAGLYDIDPEKGICVFGILIGLPAYWNLGIGRAATEAMIHIAWNTPGIHTIELRVLHKNERAIALYRSLGFVREELLQNATIKNGVPTDVVKMLLHNHGNHTNTIL